MDRLKKRLLIRQVRCTATFLVFFLTDRHRCDDNIIWLSIYEGQW
jgi:hypothetical protein